MLKGIILETNCQEIIVYAKSSEDYVERAAVALNPNVEQIRANNKIMRDKFFIKMSLIINVNFEGRQMSEHPPSLVQNIITNLIYRSIC